jgi:hypothetical protein
MIDLQPRWLYIVVAIIIAIILLDELAYRSWKIGNPGSMYPSSYRNVVPPVIPPDWR